MLNHENLLNILKEWSPWEQQFDSGIKRPEYIKEIFPVMARKEIIILKGIRRCGKSTIMRQLVNELIKSGIDKKQIVYLNFDDYRLKKYLKVELFQQVLETYLSYSKNKKKIYYFIDEIQEIQGWESFLKTIYDLGKNIKFVVTGSNASLLSKELSTLLTGRNLTFQIKPLSLKEFGKFRKDGDLNEYVTFGGFPEVVLEKNEKQKRLLLQQYFEDIMNKDIISRHSIRNVEVIFNLARGLIENSGGKVSLNKLSKQLGVSDDTISLYINYLLDAYLIIKVPFFSYSIKKRHSILAQPKYYTVDNGFLLLMSLNYTNDLGKRYENAILLKIYASTKDISYWASEGEVDFVYGNNALNVTIAQIIPEREYSGLFEFKRRYPKFNLFLVCKKPSYHKGVKEFSFEKFLIE